MFNLCKDFLKFSSTQISPDKWYNSAPPTVQAKEVLPDPEMLRKLSRLWSTPAKPKDGFSTSNLELFHITDFFLALSICNSVVVSSSHQPQHLVSLIRSSLEVCLYIISLHNLILYIGLNSVMHTRHPYLWKNVLVLQLWHFREKVCFFFLFSMIVMIFIVLPMMQ